MVGANNTALKFDPKDVRYRHLPDNYLQDAADITTPMLLVAAQERPLPRLQCAVPTKGWSR